MRKRRSAIVIVPHRERINRILVKLAAGADVSRTKPFMRANASAEEQ